MMRNLKLFATLSVVVLLLGTFSSAFGDLLVYEPFDYAADATVFGSGNWSGADPGDGTRINASGLSYPGLPTSGGKAVMAANTNNAIKLDNADYPAAAAAGWDQTDGGTFYMSYLVDGPHVDLWHNPFGAGAITRIRAGHVELFNTGVSQTTTVSDDSALKFVVMRMTMPTSGGDPGNQAIAVNPDLAQDEATIFAAGSSVSIFSLSGDAALIQFSRKPDEPETAIDEFRMATTFDEAIPEPTSLTLFGIAFLLPLLVMRQKQ